MLNKASILHKLLLVLLLSSPPCVIPSLHCPACGKTPVPYPLSTSNTCGDQSYKVRCSKGTLLFDSLHGSFYVIKSISPERQSIILGPADFARKTCVNKDFDYGGLWLDSGLPFNISASNTILKLNCKKLALASSMNCSTNSICHRYIKENPDAAAKCGSAPICCSYTAGGTQSNRLNLSPTKCMALKSFVGLNIDTSLPVSKWPEPAVEIQWARPQEPICQADSDCKTLPKSSCLPDPSNGRQKRCHCNAHYTWDPIKGACSKVVCQTKQCRSKRLRRRIITGFIDTVAAILLLLLSVFLVYKQRQRVKRKARQLLAKERQEILNSNNSGRSAKLFSEKEIKRATNNFSKDNLLGCGGFGEVFKGVLEDGTVTAVKRAKLGNTKGIDQVLHEVQILCQVNHRSLVRLLGCCVEMKDPVLVYEYILKGTLYGHLHGHYSGVCGTLSWKRRLSIARQTAEGIEYLHFSAVPQIIHRDIKSTNILLDENEDAKISDFGISRLADTDATHISTCVQGTLGYLDPEYHKNFHLTDKSDVYSFGVVLLELLTAKNVVDINREVEDVNLVAYMKKLANKERLMDAVDFALIERASKLEIETLMMFGALAMACLDVKRHNRPSIKEVSEEIEYIISIISNRK